MAQWVVDTIQIKTSTADEVTDSLYANGRMQVPVFVLIVERLSGSAQHYHLTPEELDGIELVDFYRTGYVLSDGWTYSDEENEFSHSLDASTSVVVEASVTASGLARDDSNGSSQSKQYWVSTVNAEHKNIAARITQPDGKIVTTNDSANCSHVTLKGTPPITYTTDNITIRREDTADGTSHVYVDLPIFGSCAVADIKWDQDNYYISTKDYPLTKAVIYGYDPTGYANGSVDDPRLANSYAYNPEYLDLKIFFIWDYGAETTKTAGVDRQITELNQDFRGYADIKINKQEHALCFTRLALDCQTYSEDFNSVQWPWGNVEWWYSGTGFGLYDIYGNAGHFHASYSGEYVIISDSNPSDDNKVLASSDQTTGGSGERAKVRVLNKAVEQKSGSA